MTPLNRKRIEEIRDGCKGVTPGPWLALYKKGDKRATLKNANDDFDDRVMGFFHDRPEYGEKATTNADYVANCDPGTIKALCTLALEALEADAEITRLKNIARQAFNEGVNSGMDEYTKYRGGKDWHETKSFAALQPKDSQ